MKLTSRLLLFAIMGLATSCGGGSTESWPIRPSGIPKEAQWRGGEDGGSWHDCKIKGRLLHCQKYSEKGTFRTDQAFKLCLQNEPNTWIPGLSDLGLSAVDIEKGAVQLVPVTAPTMYKNGEIDVRITEKYAKEFEVRSAHFQCGRELHLDHMFAG